MAGHNDSLYRRKQIAWSYWIQALGHVSYEAWDSGPVPDEAPAAAVNAPPPSTPELLSNRWSCMAPMNITRRMFGLEIPYDPEMEEEEAYYFGGVHAYWKYFEHHGKLKQPFDVSSITKPWTLCLRRYRGMTDQGHGMIAIPDPRYKTLKMMALQTFQKHGNGMPGLNCARHVVDSHGDDYYDGYVEPAHWMGPIAV